MRVFFDHPGQIKGPGFFIYIGTVQKIMATKVKKQEIVQDLERLFDNAKVAVVADFSGFTVAELTKFRRQLDSSKSKCSIAKNTLIKIATKSGPFASIEGLELGNLTFSY